MKVRLKAIAGDTDSLYLSSNIKITPSQAEQIGEMINAEMKKHLPPPMNFAYEAFAERMLVLEKKRYAALLLDSNGKYKMKIRGLETVRRDWIPAVGDTMKVVLDLILREGKVSEAGKYTRDMLDRIKNIDVYDDATIGLLELTRNYHKSPDAYKNKPPHMKLIERMIKRGDQIPGLGDRISFYIVGGHDDFSERAETLDYIREHHKQIDTKYYLEKQLIPPLRRIFDALDVDMMTGKKFKKAVSLDKFEDKGVEIVVPKRKKRGLDAFL